MRRSLPRAILSLLSLAALAFAVWGCCTTIGGQHVCVTPGSLTPTATPTSAPITPIPATATATSAPSATPAPSSSPSPIPSLQPTAPPRPAIPTAGAPNGCPSGSTTCGLTLWFLCPHCQWAGGKASPADLGHEQWKLADGSNPPDSSTHGTCFPTSTPACFDLGGRMWDATCTSVLSNGGWLRRLSGDISMDLSGSRDCYNDLTLVGHGTYQICLPSGAKACADPDDYSTGTPYQPGGGCEHGEVLIPIQGGADAACSGVYTR